MSITQIKMPDVGEGVTQAEIVEWNVSVGELVREDDVLAAVMTDKATIEIPAPCDGKVESVTGRPGDMIAVGSVIVELESEFNPNSSRSDQAASKNDEKALRTERSIQKPAKIKRAPDQAKVMASPAVRKLASESGVDLLTVKATGRGGRVTKGDLLAYLDRPSHQSPKPSFHTHDNIVQEIKVIGLRRKISERMQEANSRIVHFTYVEEIDVTELEGLRRHLNETSGDRPKLTLLPFIMTAMVAALRSFPHLNAHYDDQVGLLRQYSSVDIGVATQTERGLTVPVLRNADKSDLWQFAAEIRRLAESVRSGTASREELSGSTITITSLGAMGGVVATPIINSPEVAIIGVNKIRTVPVWIRDGVVPRQVLNLSSSFDHRVIDGWDAASFIQEIKAKMEHPATLFIE